MGEERGRFSVHTSHYSICEPPVYISNKWNTRIYALLNHHSHEATGIATRKDTRAITHEKTRNSAYTSVSIIDNVSLRRLSPLSRAQCAVFGVRN